jgi:NADH:ubiquinone oxidoreductase subunit 3 (subunit A)
MSSSLNTDDYLLPCLNKQLFGIECPGCGIQRSFVFLVKGDFTEAFYMYPAIYTLLLLGVILLLSIKVKFKKRKQILLTLTAINVVIILTSYVYKMTHHL